MKIFGIDPGTTTGVAIWDTLKKKFIHIGSGGIMDAFDIVEAEMFERQSCRRDVNFEVWIEDARQRKWFGKSGREVLQGVGSIKRDCHIWEEFCKNRNLKYRMVAPKNIKTKMSAEGFKKITGWQGRSNEHERDAAMICFGA